MRMPKDITPEEWRQIVALHDNGIVWSEIGRRFDIKGKSLADKVNRTPRERLFVLPSPRKKGYSLSEGPVASIIKLNRPAMPPAHLPGALRAQEQAEAMRARGASEDAIARALGQVPRSLPAGDPFGMDPRSGSKRRATGQAAIPLMMRCSLREEPKRERKIAEQQKAPFPSEVRAGETVIAAVVVTSGHSKAHLIGTNNDPGTVVWRAAAAKVLMRDFGMSEAATARILGKDRTSVRGYRERWWNDTGKRNAHYLAALRELESALMIKEAAE